MDLDLLKIHYDFINIPSVLTQDIYEHLPTLYKYGTECEHITELGFRNGNSFTSFLLSQPKKLITVDLQFPSGSMDYFDKMRGKTEIVMLTGDSRNIDLEPTDLLMFDTEHTYRCLNAELRKHGKLVNKYMIFHDTTNYRYVGEDGSKPGLMQAINEFIFDNPDWQIKEEFTNCSGLLILEKV